MGRPKMGLLTGVGGNRNGIGNYFQALDAAGIPAISVSYDDYGVVQELDLLGQASGVPHVLAFHISTDPANPDYGLPGIEAGVRFWHDIIMPRIPPEFNKENVWLIVGNEGRGDAEWGDWWGWCNLHMAIEANADGYKYMANGWSAGTPEPGVWQTQGQTAFLQYATSHPGMVGIAVHEGADPRIAQPPDASTWQPLVSDPANGISGRYRAIRARCQELGISTPPIIISECAWRYDNAPPVDIGMPHVKQAAEFYNADPEVLAVCLWYLGGGPEYAGIANKVQPYIAPITEYTLNTVLPDPDPPPELPDPPGQHQAIVVKLPQELTLPEHLAIVEAIHENRHTTTPSHDDALNLLASSGSADSFAKVPYPDRPSQVEFIALAEGLGFRWETLILDEPEPVDPLEGLVLKVPISGPWVTVDGGEFNAPRNYANGLHEGIDYAPTAPNAKVLAPADGIITHIGWDETIVDGQKRGYGRYIKMLTSYQGHEIGLLMSHMKKDGVAVAVGQNVTAGLVCGDVGETGNATGPHVHFHMTSPEFGMAGYAAANVVDPSPYMDGGVTMPPSPLPTLDLLPYLMGEGVAYMVQHPGGGQEKLRTWPVGDGRWYQLKNSQYEELWADDVYLWRGLDTSPGPAPEYSDRPGKLRYYRQFEPGKMGARWIRRNMAIGETFVGFGHTVQFRFKADCAPDPANSGPATNVTTLVARHDSLTFNGLTIHDVIEIGGGPERFFFARNWGLVAWSSSWGQSAISAVLPENEWDNVPEQGCWE